MKKLALTALSTALISLLLTACPSVPVDTGSFEFENWTRGKTGRVKFIGQAYTPDGVKQVEFANVPVKSDGSFSYTLRKPSSPELNPVDNSAILSTCNVSDKSIKTVAGEPLVKIDGDPTSYNVIVSTDEPEEAFLKGDKIIVGAVFVTKAVRVTGTCLNEINEKVQVDINWAANKWNYWGYEGVSSNGYPIVKGFEKVPGDPDFRAYIANASTLSSQSIGRKATIRPLKFIR